MSETPRVVVVSLPIDATTTLSLQSSPQSWSGSHPPRGARYSSLTHAHFVNSSTSGLHLAVRLLKERDGWIDGERVPMAPGCEPARHLQVLVDRREEVLVAPQQGPDLSRGPLP